MVRRRSWSELEGGQPDAYEGEGEVFVAFKCSVHKEMEWRFHVFEKIGVEKRYRGTLGRLNAE
jgi:hypothetical protein